MSSRHRAAARGPVRLVLATLALALLFALPATASAGTIVADSGFRPVPNGFSFPNYGDEEGYKDLDAAQMQRLFGSAVCFAGKGKSCVLTPTARLWMDTQNAEMAGGHCFGFATLTELIYDGRLRRFGYSSLSAFRTGAKTPFGLSISDVPLQRSIARAMVYQVLPAVTERAVEGTPNEILEFLRDALARPGEEGWTMLIFQRGFKGGHAITPYAVEEMGGGIFGVHVYDNNWPGDEDRRLMIDSNRDAWSYHAGINPAAKEAEYEGDAQTKTLSLKPTRPGLGVQPCSFCVVRKGLGSKYNEIRLDGRADDHAHLLIIDGRGRRTGFVGNRLVNQIPGAKVILRTSAPRLEATGSSQFTDSPEPIYKVPKNVRFKVRVNGKRLTATDRETLTLVGPTYDARVTNLVMGPGQVANVSLSPRGDALTYRSSRRTKTPTVAFGAESERAVYEVSVAALGAPPRSSMKFVKNPEQELMWIGDGTTAKRRYRLLIGRVTAAGKEGTFARAFTIRGRQQAFLYYGPLAKPNGVAKIVIYSPEREKLRVLPVRRTRAAGSSAAAE